MDADPTVGKDEAKSLAPLDLAGGGQPPAVLGLDADQTVNALANAGTLAAGLQQAFRSESMSKPLHAGRAAETGVLVAVAAANPPRRG